MDHSELHTLIDAYMDLHLDPKKKNVLQQELTVSSEAREIFWQKIYQHSLLHEVFIEASAKESAESAHRSRRSPLRIWGRAAVLAVLGLSVFMFLVFRESYPDFRISGSIRIVDDHKLAREATLTAGRNGGELVLGGYCSVALDPASTVRIEGSRYREKIFLERGRAVCRIQPDMGSFTVGTAVGEVAVQGTVFSVELIEEDNVTAHEPTGTQVHKGEKKMKCGKMIVNVMVGAVLVVGTWGDTRVAAGEARTFTDILPGRNDIADNSDNKKVIRDTKGGPRAGKIRGPQPYRPDAKGPGPHFGVRPHWPDPKQKRFREAYNLISRADKLRGQEGRELYSIALLKLEQNMEEMPYSSKIDYDYSWAVYCCVQLKKYSKAFSYYSIIKRHFGGKISTEGVTRNWDGLMNKSKTILSSYNSPQAVKTLARMETLDKTSIYDFRAELLSLVKKANSGDEAAIQTLKQNRYHIGLVELLAEHTIILSPKLQEKDTEAEHTFRCMVEGTVTEKHKDHAVFKITRVFRTKGTAPGFHILPGILLRLEPDKAGNFSKLTPDKKVKLDLDHGTDRTFHVIGIYPSGQKVKKVPDQGKHPKKLDQNKQENNIF